MSSRAVMTVLRGLARVLVSIGAWILRRRRRWGWAKIVAYLEVSAEKFADKAERVGRRAALRAEWLRGRAKRWRAAAEWLSAKGPDADLALEFAAERARAGIDAIPDNALNESFAAWRRSRPPR